MKSLRFSAVFLLLLGASIWGQDLWEQAMAPQYETLNAVKEKVNAQFYTKVDAQKLEYAAISGLLKALNDPYSRFLDPDQYDQYKLRQAGSLDGFGLQMGIRDGRLTVIAPLGGSPAQKAGILPSDVVEMLNGKSTQGMSLDEALAMIQEAANIRLRIERPKEKKRFDITLKRSKMVLKAVTSVREFGTVGYIRLATFESQNTGGELALALDQLKKPYIRSLVLDLRNNGGGLLNQAMAVLGQFIQEADAIYTIGRDGRKQPLHVVGTATYRGPLVILINRGSASSSEIVAGALKDLKRAVIVGENSFGKASVQKVIELPGGAALILTVAHYLTPAGVDISKVGIAPNYTLLENKPGTDSQLEEAVSIATEQGYKQK